MTTKVIFRAPRLSQDDEAVLAAVDELRDRARLHLARPRRWEGTLARQARARALRASNSIENINVSADEALAIVEGREGEKGITEEWLAVQGYSDAMTFARIFSDEQGRPLDLSTLLAMHFMVQKHDLSRRPGQIRRGDVYVIDEARQRTTYTGPEVAVVPGLVDELLASLGEPPQSLRDAVVTGAMAHLNLVMIHPFTDGNGRMSRILQSMQLFRAGITEADFVSVEEYLGRNTADYYDVLARVGGGRWSPGQDAHAWLEFMITAHYRQAITVQRRLWRGDRVAEMVDSLIAEERALERSGPALELVFGGWPLRNAQYREVAGVSANTASRELAALVRAGVLEQIGQKRGSRYVPGAELRPALAEIETESGRRFNAGTDPYLVLARGGELAG